MGKKRLRKGYTSKGKHSNVSRSTLNLMRGGRPSVEVMTLRNEFLASHKGKDTAFTISRANDLFKKYEAKGLTWAGAVQAVKTNWIPQLETKYSNMS